MRVAVIGKQLLSIRRLGQCDQHDSLQSASNKPRNSHLRDPILLCWSTVAKRGLHLQFRPPKQRRKLPSWAERGLHKVESLLLNGETTL
jgi:hypothetical protein